MFVVVVFVCENERIAGLVKVWRRFVSERTLAAAEAVGYTSVGVEMDEKYIAMAKNAIGALSKIR
jgi:hypothetical protein